MLEAECNPDIKDFSGRTAADIATLLGYHDVCKLLLGEDHSLDSDSPWNYPPMLNLAFDSLSLLDMDSQVFLISNQSALNAKMRKLCNAENAEAFFSSILKSHVLGHSEYQENCFQEESMQVNHEVQQLLERMSEMHKQTYPHLAFSIQLRGSAKEKTKCGFADEFDVFLRLTEFAKCCKGEVVEQEEIIFFVEQERMKLFCAEPNDAIRPYLKGDYVNAEILHNHFIYSLLTTIFHSKMWNGSQLIFAGFRCMKVGGELHLVYNGPLCKLLHISIDLVPCIQLLVHDPMPTVFDRLSKSCGVEWPVPVDFSSCHFFAVFNVEWDAKTPDDLSYAFKSSHTDFEEEMLKTLPKAAKEAYVISKALQSRDTYSRHASIVMARKFKRKKWKLDSTSYEAKWALFISYAKLLKSKGNDGIQKLPRSEWLKNMFANLRRGELITRKRRSRKEKYSLIIILSRDRVYAIFICLFVLSVFLTLFLS